MAVFIARGLAGGESGVPSGPPTPSFPDVPTGAWNYKHVEYAREQNVVQGYPSGNYEPTFAVTRDQMAVFVYRGFIQPTGAAVVLAGPAVTAQDPTAGDCGWTSVASGDSRDPGYAYVALDACRLDTNLPGPDSFFDVYFELRDPMTPTTPATGDYLYKVSLNAIDISNARADATSTGYPYYLLSWDIPGTLEADDYLLVVSITDQTDTVREAARKPAFTITP
jgi:hypothetical protein